MNPREVELKLLSSPALLQQLMASSRLLVQLTPLTACDLHSVYFDTPNRDLSRSGIVLRLRQGDKTTTQTLKADSLEALSVARDCVELEVELPRGQKDPDLTRLSPEWQKTLASLMGNQSLTPSIATQINRHKAIWRDGKGSEIEIAFDRGEITAGSLREQICEVELELKAGQPAALFALGLVLLEHGPLQIGTRSKAQRGFDLLDARQPETFKASTLMLAKSESLEKAYALILEHCLGHLLGNEQSILKRRDIEGLHQARVALRRLRSAFTVFGRVIGGDAADVLSEEAKWISNAVGRARDYDVFLHDILAPVITRNKHDKELTQLLALTQSAREEAWRQTIDAISSPRYAAFLLRMGHYLAAEDWRPLTTRDVLSAGSARNFADDALDKRLSRVMRLGRDIADLDISERHELRKRLKKLRYTLGFFASLYSRSHAKSYLEDLSDLQDVFGSLNDAAMAKTLLERHAINNPDLAKAVAKVLTWHEDKAGQDWKAALKLWQRFSRHDPFWHN